MKLNLLSTVVAGLSIFAIPFASAKNFQSEIKADYSEIDYDGSSADHYAFGLTGTYYFSSVDTSNRPLAESAFLQKASSISIGGAYDEYKDRQPGFSETEHRYGRGIDVDFYIPNSIFYLGAGISEFKYKDVEKLNNVTNRYSEDWNSQWTLRAGVTPIDGLLVWTEFYEDVDVSDYLNVHAKYVMPIGTAGQWLNLEASYENIDSGYSDLRVLELAADYYLDTHLSIGAGLAHYDASGNNGNENEYFIRANQYFTDNVAVNLSYADGDFESRWGIGATIRF